MRVLNVVDGLDARYGGGTGERTLQMSRFLVKAGVKCTVMSVDMGANPEFKNALTGVNIVMLPCLYKRFYVPTFSATKIKNVVESADVIHLMSHWAVINALVYLYARLMKKPYVVCPAGSLPVHDRSKLLKRLYNWIIGKKIILNASLLIAVTENEVTQFKPYGVDINKVSVIPNAIDKEDYFKRDDQGFRKKYGLGDHPIILFVGRLNPIKGPDLLLTAFCKVKDKFLDYHLVFAGLDEGLLPELQKTVKEFGVEERVHFIGYVEKNIISIAYYASNLLVIPSRYEAMSIVVLEAGITATPVLITDQCGFDVAKIGGGMVVSPSVDGLQKGLIEMLSNRDRLKTMGVKLQKYITENLTWDIIVYKYIDLYKQILERAK